MVSQGPADMHSAQSCICSVHSCTRRPCARHDLTIVEAGLGSCWRHAGRNGSWTFQRGFPSGCRLVEEGLNVTFCKLWRAELQHLCSMHCARVGAALLLD